MTIRKPNAKALELAALLQSMIDDGTISDESFHYAQQVHAFGRTIAARNAAKEAGDVDAYRELCETAAKQFNTARCFATRNKLQPLGEVLRELHITL